MVIKIADKITNISKKPVQELSNNNNDEKEGDVEITTHKKRYILPEERQRIIDELNYESRGTYTGNSIKF